MIPRGIQWWLERSFKQTELSLISHSPLLTLVFLSVFGMFVFTDLSAIALPCYVGINSSGKKACTFLLSSFGSRARLSYMTFFAVVYTCEFLPCLRINWFVNVAPRCCDCILTLPCNPFFFRCIFQPSDISLSYVLSSTG